MNNLDYLGLAEANAMWGKQPPCGKNQKARKIQVVYNARFFFKKQKPFVDGPRKIDGKGSLRPFYRPDKIPANALFQDSPKGANGTPTFELCHVCVCRKDDSDRNLKKDDILSIGPCIHWIETDAPKGSMTELGDLPLNRHRPTPTSAFLQAVDDQFGNELPETIPSSRPPTIPPISW